MKHLPIVATLLVASTAQAAPMTLTSLAEFNTAIAGASTNTETFDNDIPGQVSITFDNGTTSTLSGGTLSFPEFDNVVTGGVFQGTVVEFGLGAKLLTLDFGAPVIGFGADFISGGNPDLLAGGDNSGVELSVDDGVTFFDLTDVLGASEGFLGVVDLMAPFQTVQFRNNTVDLTTGVFGIDNLILASTDTAAVPVPASALLLAAALGGLGVLRRRSSQQG